MSLANPRWGAPRHRERHNGMLRRSSSAAQNGQGLFGCEECAKGSGLPETRPYVCCVADLYDRTRTHLTLEKDAPVPRRIQPPEMGRVVELAQVGGLHHRYERVAA